MKRKSVYIIAVISMFFVANSANAQSYTPKVSKDSLIALSGNNTTFTVEAAKNTNVAQDIDSLIADLTNLKTCIDTNTANTNTELGKKAPSHSVPPLVTITEDSVAEKICHPSSSRFLISRDSSGTRKTNSFL